MKRFFASCGKAAFYFSIFFGMQLLVPIVYAIVMTTSSLPILSSDPDAILTFFLQVIEDDLIPANLLCSLMTIGIYLLTAPMRKHNLRDHFSLYPLNRAAILPLVLLGFSSNLALNVLLRYLPFPQSWWDSYEAASSVIPNDPALIPMLAVSIVGPITEELCFRGLIFTRLKHGMGGLLAALVSSLIFGAVHGTMIWFCYASALGLLMVWLFSRFGTLWASIVFHISFNLVNFFISGLSESLSTILSFVGCAATIACILWIRKLSRQ